MNFFSRLYKLIRYILRPFGPQFRRFGYRLSYIRHFADSDPRRFDWNWNSINFNRASVVSLLLSTFKSGNPKYLEIGCGSNATFDTVPLTEKVGVDPWTGGNFRGTSDFFFSQNHSLFDVIFIDGHHEYNQARRDLENALKVVKPGGFIILHDMLPRTWIEEHVPIVSVGAWTGNVWKLAFELIGTAGVEFKIFKIDCGVGVVKVNTPDVKLLDLRGELNPRKFSYFADSVGRLPLVDFEQGKAWIKD